MSSKPIVLVTGLNGFIGSHVGDQFLTAGYNVRGTTRTLEKGQVIKKLLTEKHGEGRVEIVAVPNISSEGAFDQVVKGNCHQKQTSNRETKAQPGIHAVAHVASILSFDKDASKVIPATVAATTSILTSCLKEPTIKSFVLTSSSTAACRATANVKRTINSNSWNEDDVREAWKPESEWQEGHEWIVYGASKTEAEKALWNFRDEKKPAFTTNAVLPATVFGPVLLPEEASSTGAFVKMIYGGVILPLQGVLPRSYFVLVQSDIEADFEQNIVWMFEMQPDFMLRQ